ncbi:MAG: Secretion system C-terminal sorting domain [Bacteroidota bacterium]
MKKILTSIFCLVATFSFAQIRFDTITVGKNEFAISGNTYSFFQTVPAVTWNRSVYIYPKQVVYRNLRPNTNFLQGFWLYRDVTRVSTVTPAPGRLRGGSRAKVWLAQTDSTDFANVTTWSDAQRIFNPKIIINRDIKNDADTSSGYKYFRLDSFDLGAINRNKNLYIAVEYIQDSAAIDQIYWSYDSTSVKPNDVDTTNYFSRLQFRFCHRPSSGVALVDGFTGSNIRHPHIKFVYRDPTKTEDLPSVEALSVSPNPVSNGVPLTLKFKTSQAKGLNFIVYDLSGRMLYEKNAWILGGASEIQIPTVELPNGILLLNIYDENGNLSTAKFLKN